MSDPANSNTNTLPPQINTTPSDGADVDIIGSSAPVLGLPSAVKTAIDGMWVLELSDDAEPQFTIEVPGQDGAIATFAVSKKKKFSGTGNGILLDEADFLGVKKFAFNGRTYIITKHGAAYNYKDAVKASFSYVGYEGLE